MKKKLNLEDILNSDPLGALTYVPRSTARNGGQRLVDSFLEINDFYDMHGRAPEQTTGLKERELWSRLKGIKENMVKVDALREYDKYDLLTHIDTLSKVESVADILSNDPLGILETDTIDIHTLKNVPEISQDRASADFVARREKCEDFDRYEDMFIECQKDLDNGKRKLIESVEAELSAGKFCVLDGVLLFVVRVYDPVRGNSNKLNRRTEIVFENGTKSHMLLRSLGKRLKDAGKMVTSLESDVSLVEAIIKDDVESGYIYVLRSLSNDDHISMVKDLYKIGYSSGAVEDRIKKAEKDPTYLMASVEIVQTFKVFNMNTYKLEQLVHTFFGGVRLDIDIIDMKGNARKPREWFVAPLHIIEVAIEMIVDGSILNYRYDTEGEEIVLK